jgi:hypothetical protein
MKKSVLFLLFLLSVQGLHAQNAHPTFTWNETTKELNIDGNGGDLCPGMFGTSSSQYVKFSESIYKDAVKITIKNVGTIYAQTFGDINTEATLELYIYTSVNKINAQAFDHLRVHDVFVVRDDASHEKNGGFIPCELNAFDFNTCVNQTGTDLIHIAKLHIPDGDSFYNYYVGEWKSRIGLLSQEALNVCKDGGEVIIRYYENGREITQTIRDISVANGFQQFASTDNENQIILAGSFIRTYSSDTPKKVPTLTIGGTEKDMFNAYRIKNFSYDAGTINKNSELESVIQNHIIPANTGVILMSDFEIKKDIIVYLGNVSEATNLDEYPYQNDLSKPKANLLVPSTYKEDGVVTNGVSVGPVDRDSQGKVTHRNFGLYYNSDDKYYHFSRYKPGNVPANKAYLKLTKDQFPNSNEDEYGIGANLARGMAKQANQSTSSDQISIDLPESKYFNLEVLFVDNDLGVTTNIDKIDNITNNDKYYNLQGMEVKNPAKGVYIKNGKKIIVK